MSDDESPPDRKITSIIDRLPPTVRPGPPPAEGHSAEGGLENLTARIRQLELDLNHAVKAQGQLLEILQQHGELLAKVGRHLHEFEDRLEALEQDSEL